MFCTFHSILISDVNRGSFEWIVFCFAETTHKRLTSHFTDFNLDLSARTASCSDIINFSISVKLKSDWRGNSLFSCRFWRNAHSKRIGGGKRSPPLWTPHHIMSEVRLVRQAPASLWGKRWSCGVMASLYFCTVGLQQRRATTKRENTSSSFL